MTQVTTINLFYPLMFLAIIVIAVIIGIVIIKIKDSSLFNNIFNRHVDEHIDTTNKFSLSHTEIVSGLPIVYHYEIHDLECKIKNIDKKIDELIKEINILKNN